MISLPPPPRPRRSLSEALRLVAVASLVDREAFLAALRRQVPPLFTQPVGRVYQLPCLDAANLAPFEAAFGAGRPHSLRWLGYFAHELADWWAEPMGEPVGVCWLRGRAGGRYGVVVLLGRGGCRVLPVSGWLLALGLWLLPGKRILW